MNKFLKLKKHKEFMKHDNSVANPPFWTKISMSGCLGQKSPDD